MAIHDTIGDFLTSVRNGSMATKPIIQARYSKLRESIAAILKAEGYLLDFTVKETGNGIKTLEIKLKFKGDQPVIAGISRESKPGCRAYYQYAEIPPVLGGLGISILTTSRGVLTGADARKHKVGGELLCTVW